MTMARPADSEFRESILGVLRTAEKISHGTDAALRRVGLSKEQYFVLRILRERRPKPLPVHRIASRMISKSSNATRLVEKLRQKGYVSRTRSWVDRRRMDVRITNAGRAILDMADGEVEACWEKMRRLNRAEIRQLSRLLEKIRS